MLMDTNGHTILSEDYVSVEVAKLLKEKGFDIPLNYFYNSDGRRCYATSYNWNQTTGDFQDYSCPTHQMAMKWLREVHQLHISVDVAPIYGKVKNGIGWNSYGLLYWHYMASGEWMNEKYNPQQKSFVVSEKSYKKVCEAALKYSLNNLI